MITLQPHTRTIYFDYYESGGIFKYKLNLPKMTFEKKLIDGRYTLEVKVYDNSGKECVLPFPNSTSKGYICLKSSVERYSEKELVAKFFNMPFCHSSNLIFSKYIKGGFLWLKTNAKTIHEFYKTWEETGKLKLVPLIS